MNIIKVPFDRLERVVHLADIHIRLFKRHREYRRAFDRLYEDIQKEDLNNTAIVVAGDILHAKLDLSPEMIDLASDFLVQLAKLAPTLVIDGNHDLNLANPHRMNSLEPIINNIGHPNLHYLKDSGIYKVADTEFALYGVSNKPADWPSPEEMTSEVKVCLFHGPVYGATTDTKFTITSRHMNLAAFNGFDVVMLGDIHKHQVLNSADPVVVYSSSLIQQNHGETIRGHGWVLWDIPSKTFEFKELESDYGYVTLEVDSENLANFSIPGDWPTNIRLRLFTDHIENTTLKKVLSMVKKQYNVLDVSINPRRLSPGASSKKQGVDIGDLTDLNIQNQLISEWVVNHYPNISDGLLHAIMEVNKHVNEQITYNDQSRNISWRPLEFWFSNLFSYGEGNYINFADMESTNGIFAANATGKSSSMEALIYTLFDKTPRAFRGDHIMNTRKDDFHCKLSFEVNGVVYYIERVGKKKNNGSVKVDVEFWKEDADGEKISLNGEGRYDTNANIRAHVGTYEDFILTSLSGQTGNSLFIDKSHTERKTLLNQFMGLIIFEHLWNAANDESREIQGVLKKFSKEDFTGKLAELQTKIEAVTEDSIRINTEIGDYQRDVDLKQREIETLSSKRAPVPDNIEDADRLIDEKEGLSTKVLRLDENCGILRGEFDIMTDQLTELREIIGSVDESALKDAYEHYNAMEKELQKIKHDAQTTLKVMESKKIQAKSLSEFKYNPECEVCIDNNRSKIEQLGMLEVEISELETLWDKLNRTINELEDGMKELAPACADFNKLKRTRKEYDRKKLAVDGHRNSIDRYQNQIDTVEGRIRELVGKIELATKYHDQIEANDRLNEKIAVQKNQLMSLKAHLNELDSEKLTLHGELKVFEDRRSEILKELQEVSKLEKEFEAYRYYLETVSRDGLPYDIISETIPTIEAEINNILSQIVPFTIQLDVDGKNVGGKIVYDVDKSWPLENSSGMERFISSLAIRVALLKASNLPKSNFLIIDEGMGSLDTEYLHGMQLLFEVLKEQFDFLVIISHLDNIRDMVDNIIEIQRVDGYSYINN